MNPKARPLLRGRTFLITRTVEGNKIEKEKLESFGAEVIELPLIEIQPPSDPEQIDRAVDNIGRFEWIVFTSANGVTAFFNKVKERGKHKESITARFACVGPGTQNTLEDLGLKPSFVPKKFLTRALGQEMVSTFELRDSQVLLARAEGGSKDLANIFSESGVKFVDAPVYRTVEKKLENVSSDLLDKVTDITLTSPSTVRGLALNFTYERLASPSIRIHCIGPMTEQSAKSLRLNVSTTSNVHTIDGLIDAIIKAS